MAVLITDIGVCDDGKVWFGGKFTDEELPFLGHPSDGWLLGDGWPRVHNKDWKIPRPTLYARLRRFILQMLLSK